MNVHMVTYWTGKRKDDGRPWPRFVHYLQNYLGWSVSSHLDSNAHVNYVLISSTGWRKYEHPWEHRSGLLACTFGCRPRYGLKARLWDEGVKRADLRLVTSQKHAAELTNYGPTEKIDFFPIEHDLFKIAPRPIQDKPTVGVAGYHASAEEGMGHVKELAYYPGLRHWRIKGAGTGWPMKTRLYDYRSLPTFYQSLDLFLSSRTGEAASSSVFQALACGIPVVVCRGMPPTDELLPEMHGIYRYEMGNFDAMIEALRKCTDELGTHDRKALRATTKELTIENFCEQHRRLFEKHFG